MLINRTERAALQLFVELMPAFEVEQLAGVEVVAIFANTRASLLQAVPWLERVIREEIGTQHATRPCWLMAIPGEEFSCGTERITPAPRWWTLLHLAHEHGLVS